MHREQEAKTGRKLSRVLPGIGYHCDKPLLYYSRRLAAEAGYEELQLSYTFSGGNIRGNKEKMREAFFALYEQAKEQLGVVDWSACDEILFVSKSIGTIISAAYVAEQKISCRQILYTPLEDTFRVEEALAESHKQTVSDKQTTAVQVQGTIPSIAFIGTADPWSEVPRVIALSKRRESPSFPMKAPIIPWRPGTRWSAWRF